MSLGTRRAIRAFLQRVTAEDGRQAGREGVVLACRKAGNNVAQPAAGFKPRDRVAVEIVLMNRNAGGVDTRAASPRGNVSRSARWSG